MDRRKSYVLVAFFVLLISMEAALVWGDGDGNNGNGNNGNGNGNGDGNGNSGNGNGNGNGNNGNGNGDGGKGNNGNGKGKKNQKKDDKKKDNKKTPYDASTDYEVLSPLSSGQERSFCKAAGDCHSKTLTCPAQCPQKKPKKNKKNKGCFVDCSSKCEATCKCKPHSRLFFLFKFHAFLNNSLILHILWFWQIENPTAMDMALSVTILGLWVATE